ncbi:hypothetical protein ATCC90586_005484 [Pythium insidiosum]|nr:hypothetical protein ATCC90586_005484 [Pythium insidiosum]
MKRRRVGRMPELARAVGGAAAALWAVAQATPMPSSMPLLRGHRHLALSDVDLPALLQQIGPLECQDSTAQIVAKLLNANAMLVEQCQTDSGYRLFKGKMEPPEQEQIVKICASPSCTDFLSGIILAKLPECEYAGYSPRSMAEGVIRIRVDLANHRSPPKPSDFSDLYTLNRVINYLSENTTIRANVKTTLKPEEVKPLMNQLEINPDVVLSADYVVYMQANSARTPSPGGGGGGTTRSPGTPAPSMSKADGETRSRPDALPYSTRMELAYFYVALCWIAVNVFYVWAMSGKSPNGE